MLKIAVGSKNIVKIKAVEEAFRKVFGDVEVQGVEVNPGVSHTPSSWEELVQGGINRAQQALQEISGDFGVGLEGGYEKTKFGFFLTGAVVIIDKEGKMGIARSGGFLLPKRIEKELRKGRELGEIMDEIQGKKNTKQQEGAIGFFTKNYSNRQESFELAVLYALSRFLRSEFYEN
jgi:inosine/xanthosine triphosphatase